MKYNKYLTKRQIRNLLMKNNKPFDMNETKEILLIKLNTLDNKNKLIGEDIQGYLRTLKVSQIKTNLEFLDQKVTNQYIKKQDILDALIYHLQEEKKFEKFMLRNINQIKAYQKKLNDDSKKQKKKDKKKHPITSWTNRIIRISSQDYVTPIKSSENNSNLETEVNSPKDSLMYFDKEIEKVGMINMNKYEAVVMYKHGKSISEISDYLQTDYKSVKDWLLKFFKYGDVTKKVSNNGRKNLIGEQEEEYIKEKVSYRSEVKIVRDLKKDLDEQIGKTTIYNYLDTIGKFKRPKEIVDLSEINKHKRLIYCNKMLGKSLKNIVFSDESMID